MEKIDTPEEIIAHILSNLQIELVWSLVLAGIAFYFLILFKEVVNNLLFYFQFRSNSYVSIGTLVEVNKFIGRIKKISISYVIIEGEKGYFRIPMKNWQKEKWIFLRTEWKQQDVRTGQRLGLRKNDDIKVDRKSPEYKEILAKTKSSLGDENEI